MKILMVSMASIHFFRWTEQLKNSGHEVYWIDVYDSNSNYERIDFVQQTVGWRNRINFPGRYFIKNRYPRFYRFVNKFNQQKLSEVFLKKVLEIRPDVVHSFIMFSACAPIIAVMRKFPDIPLIYSAWGNDLFFLQNETRYLDEIKGSLGRVNYMFADCDRDHKIAQGHGFKGKYLGTFPTGGGYDTSHYDSYASPNEQRDVILIKGYQHEFGRCISVLKAVKSLKDSLKNYKIVVFAAHSEVFRFLKDEEELRQMDNLKVIEYLPQEELLKLMGNSLIYIGNSISDGMPNTLLEAIVMRAFPIQSNPGGATGEIVEHAKNGYLIEDPDDYREIEDHIQRALDNTEFLRMAVAYNNKYIRPKLEREYIKTRVLEKYALVEAELNS